jgi:hypothetical protein
MSLPASTNGRLLSLAAVLGATAVMVIGSSAVPAAAQQAPNAKGGENCTVQTFTEQTVNAHDIGAAGPDETVGDGGTYYDDITDSAGQAAGNAIGYYTDIAQQASDGHLIAQYAETVHTTDGTFRDTGIIDRTAVFGGAWAVFHAVGVSGIYAHEHGIREWRVIDAATLTAEVRIDLCH